MSIKKKGTNAERELIHMLWKTGNWCGIRVAGSGSNHYPSPDIIASNGNIIYAIECKASKTTTKYIPKAEIDQLTEFASVFGAIPIIGVRYNNKGWMFIKPEDGKDSGNNIAITFHEPNFSSYFEQQNI